MNLRQMMVFGLLAAVTFGSIGYGVWMLSGSSGTAADPGQSYPEPEPAEEALEGDEALITADGSLPGVGLEGSGQPGPSPAHGGIHPVQGGAPAERDGGDAGKLCLGPDGMVECGTVRTGHGGSWGHAGGGRLVAHIELGRPDVRGSLDRAVIERILRRHQGSVRSCYERQLRSEPELAGTVTITFIIAPTGEVQASLLSSSSLRSPPVEQCLVQRARRWRFPAPAGGGVVRVNYPFTFSSRPAEEAETGRRGPPLDPNGRPMRPGVWTGTVGGGTMMLDGVMRLRRGEQPSGAGIYTGGE